MAVTALLLYVMPASRQAIASPNMRFGQFFLDFFSGDTTLWFANMTGSRQKGAETFFPARGWANIRMNRHVSVCVLGARVDRPEASLFFVPFAMSF